MSRRRKTTPSPFGETVLKHLSASGETQANLAAAANVSPAYVNNTLMGRKAVSPTWADLIADVLALDPKDRARLHYEAARTQGYKLDLTKP